MRCWEFRKIQDIARRGGRCWVGRVWSDLHLLCMCLPALLHTAVASSIEVQGTGSHLCLVLRLPVVHQLILAAELVTAASTGEGELLGWRGGSAGGLHFLQLLLCVVVHTDVHGVLRVDIPTTISPDTLREVSALFL